MTDDEHPLSWTLIEERHKYERLFSACAFISPEVALERCSWLDPSDFCQKEYGDFWRGLKDHGDSMKAAADAHLLSELSGSATEIPSSLFPEHYANEMKRFEYLWDASEDMAGIALAISEHDELEVKNKVAKLHIREPGKNSKQVPSPADISSEFIRRIYSQSPSLLTGLDDLDAVLGGLFVGELTIVAGRPGIGKTSIATAISQNIASANKDAKILFFSLEMDKVQLWARMACAKTPYSWQEIRTGRADAGAVKAVEEASKQLEIELGDRLIIEDSTWDVPSMISICANIKPSLVVIDHLSEIRWKDDNAEEVKWFGRATKLLRTEISRRMHIPVILLHQLNRGVETRTEKRPQLSDLKWSGDLEAIADAVLMLYREDYYDEKAMKKPRVVPMEVWVKKNRQGVMNSCVIVNFDTRTQRFIQAKATTSFSAVDKIEHLWYNRQQ
jgi:replicative DNA helicase